jgi:hypothetical protein
MSDDAMRPDDERELDVNEAELGLLLPPAAAPAGDATRARLLARAAADNAALGVRRSAPGASAGSGAGTAQDSPTRAVPPSPSPVPLHKGILMPRWAMGFAMFVPIAGLMMMMKTRDELETTRGTFAEADRVRTRVIDSLNARLAERDAQVAALTGERVYVVDMADARSLKPMGRMFWDQATDRWTFTAHHLPMPPKGRTYQLWLVVDGHKMSCGTFMPTAGGTAEVHQVMPVKPGMLQAVAVTEEPMGGMPQPTGPMVVLGKAAQ